MGRQRKRTRAVCILRPTPYLWSALSQTALLRTYPTKRLWLNARWPLVAPMGPQDTRGAYADELA